MLYQEELLKTFDRTVDKQTRNEIISINDTSPRLTCFQSLTLTTEACTENLSRMKDIKRRHQLIVNLFLFPLTAFTEIKLREWPLPLSLEEYKY